VTAAIETDRLVLRRWRDGDAGPLSAINADPEVMRWIGSGATADADRTRAAIGAWERIWETEGFGLFAVEVRSTGELAGLTGLAIPHFLPEIMPAVEIAWRLGRPFWGLGIATEAARAVLRFAMIDCGLERIVSIVQIGNGASERIMQKLGMYLDRETTDPGSGRPVRVYAITQPDYLRQSSARSPGPCLCDG
jgi:RimJ/RimL family protein N-acetyltransferase